MVSKNLIVRAPFCVRSGYETLSETICVDLSKNKYNIFPLSTNGEITNPLIKKLIKPIYKELLLKTELCIIPIQSDVKDFNTMFRIPKVGKRVFFTMWESTQLSLDVSLLLNTGEAIIVPNEWNKQNFKLDGIIVPIHKCPLFVDTSIYNYKPPVNSIFTFGTGNADPRKRLNDVIKCFCKAFSPSIKDVQLLVKINRQDKHKVIRVSDERVKINVDDYSKQQLADWYHSLDVFVSGASAEGWGLMQHEAMACGRPLIACQYAGLAEFFDDTVGFPLKYTEVPSEWSWGYSNGFWSKFDENDMIEKFRWCYNNKQEVIKKGINSSKQASLLNIGNFVNKLTNILQIYDI